MKEDFAEIIADMAQSVAHLIGSEEVTGSIPVISLKRDENLFRFPSLFICYEEAGGCAKQQSLFYFQHKLSYFLPIFHQVFLNYLNLQNEDGHSYITE